MSTPTAIITGGSRGIGLATALRFAKRGHNVVIAARSAGPLKEAAEQIEAAGAAVEAVAADVSKDADTRRVIKAATDRFGGLDVLVNNAGFAPIAHVAEMSDSDFETTMNANCAATFYMTRAAWPALKQSHGVIVNVSSVASIDPFGGFAVYGACKAWVNLFTLATAKTGKEDGIRVYAVAPGATETQMLRGALPDIPADQVLDPDDIAAVIETCCGESMQHSVGQVVYAKR